MTTFTIPDSQLDAIRDQVVLITGASSGIGLATLRRVIQHGGKVFASDINPLPQPEGASVPFIKANVASWQDQVDMFKAAEKEYGKIDHVFANAGVGMSAPLVDDEVDEKGEPRPPKLDTININLIGVMYSVKLGIHYLRKNPCGGSIVTTASGSSFTRVELSDYSMSKHAVLGLTRALYRELHPKLPIRINSIAPSWTDTAIVPREVIALFGEGSYQTADVVARSAMILMVDQTRHGEMVYSDRGKFVEMENGATGFHAQTKKTLGFAEDEETSEAKAWQRAQEGFAAAAS
ncbi:hypothetical protein ACJQWK_02321 [Exserohilum turcicum]